MDYNEMRQELGKLTGIMHMNAHNAWAAKASSPADIRYLCAKGEAWDMAAQLVVDLIRKLDGIEDRSLMDQAQEQYEKSEKDALWERD